MIFIFETDFKHLVSIDTMWYHHQLKPWASVRQRLNKQQANFPKTVVGPIGVRLAALQTGYENGLFLNEITIKLYDLATYYKLVSLDVSEISVLLLSDCSVLLKQQLGVQNDRKYLWFDASNNVLIFKLYVNSLTVLSNRDIKRKLISIMEDSFKPRLTD